MPTDEEERRPPGSERQRGDRALAGVIPQPSIQQARLPHPPQQDRVFAANSWWQLGVAPLLAVVFAQSMHDFRVDLIVTPEDVIWCDERRRPAGIIWNSLSQEKVEAIPALAARQSAGTRPD
ncbi:hypothetical protein [Nocardia pneumoniae]|uniref:hypothetical protein n=1 Tax=Nocardia pneumoniae TaxID=228601 RepID=UPI0012F6FE70|nr:hypothetical protein [Nocardia pneumoniae]